jgi:hypothetical protein
MRYIVGFGRFWYDFIIGDDWRIAVGVVMVLSVSAVAIAVGVVNDWLAPLVGVGLIVTFAAPTLRSR